MTEELKEKLNDPKWRLNNLYFIQDDEANIVPFKFNANQEKFWHSMWTRNIILKARQLGFTTLIDLMLLDACLFNPGVEAAIIADTQSKAQDIFRRKIVFPYEHLSDPMRLACPLREGTKGSAGQYQFANGSVISVGVSIRSSTVQLLHVSELGIMSRNDPQKAREVVTGTLRAVRSPAANVFIESTARGPSGPFYEMCVTAQKLAADKANGLREELRRDYRFHFYPWYQEPRYSVPANSLPISKHLLEYFRTLKVENGIELEQGQKEWYQLTYDECRESMLEEFPSTPEEAFATILEGSFFKKEFLKIREDGRMCDVPYQSGCPVHTYWDLGYDTTAIWFAQLIGGVVHLIDFYENEGEGMAHYARICQDKEYVYAQHYAPWDVVHRTGGKGKTKQELYRELGIKFDRVPRANNKNRDSIELARQILNICWFDKTECEQGIKHLENYRKEKDKLNGGFKDRPVKNKDCHASDAFQTLAMSYNMFGPARRMKRRKRRSNYKWI